MPEYKRGDTIVNSVWLLTYVKKKAFRIIMFKGIAARKAFHTFTCLHFVITTDN